MASRPHDESERAMAQDIGAFFRNRRRELGWTVNRAARAARIYRHTIKEIEGGRFPTWPAAYRLAVAYGLKLADVAALIDNGYAYEPAEEPKPACRAVQVCGVCSKSGHNKTTCPRASEVAA